MTADAIIMAENDMICVFYLLFLNFFLTQRQSIFERRKYFKQQLKAETTWNHTQR